MTTAGAATTRPVNKVLRTIAVLKFMKTAAVLATGVAALKLLNPATLDAINAWTQALPAPLERQFAQRALDHLSGISPHQLEALGAGAFVLAAIFLIEGIGLWLERAWAEWLSVIATALFIPLEILELFRHVTAPKLLALVLNTLVVVYLIYRIRSEKRENSKSTAPGPV